jgi:hypothetical protein
LYLGGLGMFALALRWLGDGRAATVAGIGYAFGGVMLSSLMWPNNIAALGWLPFALLSGEQAAVRGGRSCLKSIVIVAMQFLAGAPEIIALTWAGLIALSLWGQQSCSVPLGLRCRRLALVFALTLGLVSIQLLPFLELLRLSHRHGLSTSLVWSLPWSGLGNFLVPLFRTFQDRDGIYFQFEQQWITSYYTGTTILSLALIGLFTDRSRRSRLLGLLCLLALGFALGSHGAIYEWLRSVVPGLGIMRYPVKFIVPVAVLLPLLAGCGARAWFQGNVDKTGGLLQLILGAGALLVAGLAWWHPIPGENTMRTWQSGIVSVVFMALLGVAFIWGRRSKVLTSAIMLPLVIAALVFGDLGIANRHINPTVESRVMRGTVTPIDSPPRLGDGRVMVNSGAQALLDGTIFPTSQQAVLIPRQSLMLNANLLEMIPKLDGFFSLYLPQPTAVVTHLPEDTNAQPARLLDFLGVSYQSQPDRPWQWNERSRWLPLATLVSSATFLEVTNAFWRLFSDQFHPGEQVILDPDVKDQVKANAQGHGKILSSRVAPPH